MSAAAFDRRRLLLADLGLTHWVSRDRLLPAADPSSARTSAQAELSPAPAGVGDAPAPALAPALDRLAALLDDGDQLASPAVLSRAVSGAEVNAQAASQGAPAVLSFTALQCTWVAGAVHLGPPPIGAPQRRFLADVLLSLRATSSRGLHSGRPEAQVLRPETLPPDLSPDERIAGLLAFVGRRISQAAPRYLLLATELLPELRTLLQEQLHLEGARVALLPPLDALMLNGAQKAQLWAQLAGGDP